MLIFEVELTIDDFIANTESNILMYFDNELICCLNSNNRIYRGRLYADKNINHTILIKREYSMAENTTTSLIKTITSIIVSYLLVALSCIEPFNCLRECEEIINLSFTGNNPKINIKCTQQADALYPQIDISNTDSYYDSSKTTCISIAELNDSYNERKKMISYFAILPIILDLLIFIIAIIKINTTTILFTLLIFFLIIISTILSFKKLKEDYIRLKAVSTQSRDGSVIDD